MIYAICKEDIFSLTCQQLTSIFMLQDQERKLMTKYFGQTLERLDKCFAKNHIKYYKRNDETYFNPFHSVQYMKYLYFLSNTIYRNEGGVAICDKIYYLNKMLNGLDLFYAVNLPEFFMAEHPVGTVIGGATYGEGFLFYQGCTVGGYHEKDGSVTYPTLGENVRMYANSSIIGRCTIGDNVNIGANAHVKNQDIPSDCNVFGQYPNLIIKNKTL